MSEENTFSSDVQKYLELYQTSLLDEYIDTNGLRPEHCGRPKSLEIINGRSLFSNPIATTKYLPDPEKGVKLQYKHLNGPWTFSLVCTVCGHVDSYRELGYREWFNDQSLLVTAMNERMGRLVELVQSESGYSDSDKEAMIAMVNDGNAIVGDFQSGAASLKDTRARLADLAKISDRFDPEGVI